MKKREPGEEAPTILDEMQLADVQPPAEEPEAEEGQPDALQGQEEQEKEVTDTHSSQQEVESDRTSEGIPPDKPAVADPARFAALEQSLTEERTARERERTAMLREIMKLRRSRQADEQPAAPQPPPRIPVEFDEQGQPFVSPEALARIMGPSSPADSFMQQHRRMAESLILENPVPRSQAHSKFREAFDALDEAVRYAQFTNNRETPDLDSMMALIEDAGLVERFTKEFPEVAKDSRDIEDFLMASTSMNPRRMSKLLDRISNNLSSGKEPVTDYKETESRGGIKEVAERMSTKPPPMRRIGSVSDPKSKSRLEALSEKSPFEWNDNDRKAFLQEMESLDNQATEG